MCQVLLGQQGVGQFQQSYQCFPEITLKGLSIATDKLHYFANETISVLIEPKNTPVKLEYANETYIVENSISLLANPLYSRVIAYSDDEKALKVISVTEKSNLILASKIILFGMINYVIFAVLTRKVWVLKWLNVVSQTQAVAYLRKLWNIFSLSSAHISASSPKNQRPTPCNLKKC